MNHELRIKEEEIKNRILDTKEGIIHYGGHYTELDDCQLQAEAIKEICQLREQLGEPYKREQNRLKLYEKRIKELEKEGFKNKDLEASLFEEVDPIKAAKTFTELKTKTRLEYKTAGFYFGGPERRPTKEVYNDYYDHSNAKFEKVYKKLGVNFLQKTLQNLKEYPKIQERIIEDVKCYEDAKRTGIRICLRGGVIL